MPDGAHHLITAPVNFPAAQLHELKEEIYFHLGGDELVTQRGGGEPRRRHTGIGSRRLGRAAAAGHREASDHHLRDAVIHESEHVRHLVPLRRR